jgi:hypothetical protein
MYAFLPVLQELKCTTVVDVQDQYASVCILQGSSHYFAKYGYYSGLFWRSGVMSFYALLFGFWFKMVEPAFITCYKVK